MSNMADIKQMINDLSCSDEYIEVLEAIRGNMERDIKDWTSEQDSLNPEIESHFEEHKFLQSMIDYLDEYEPRLKRIIEQMKGLKR